MMTHRSKVKTIFLIIILIPIVILLTEYLLSSIRIKDSRQNRGKAYEEYKRISKLPSPTFTSIDNMKELNYYWDPFEKKFNQTKNKNVDINSSGKRVVLEQKTNYPKFLAMLGASITFGHGVKDKENIPYYLQQELENHRVYNHGIIGGSLTSHLLRLANGRLRQDLIEKEGTFILTISDPSFYRIRGTPHNVSYIEHAPWLVRNKNKFGFNGSLKTNSPLRWLIYRYLENSTFRYLLEESPEKNYFQKPEKDDLCEIIGKMNSLIINNFSNSKLIIFYTDSNFSTFLKGCIDKHKISLLIYPGERLDQNCHLSTGHYTSKANYDIANWLRHKVFNEELLPSTCNTLPKI